MEDFSLKDFLNYYKKHILFVVIMALILVSASVIYNVRFKKPVYTARTSIVLVKGNAVSNVNTQATDDALSVTDVTLNQKLVATYRKIIKSRLVLEQVIKNLNLGYSYAELAKEVTVNASDDAEILEISVTDLDPNVSANIANSIATVFDNEVEAKFNINNVSVLDVAQVPTSVSNDTLVRDVFLAVIIAFVGCSAIIFVVYYFDDTLRDSDNLDDELDLPVLGKIYKDPSGIDLILDKQPKAVASENIRTLRTNLQFASIDKKVKTILITSTMPQEGKSFISANLATSFAQSGKKVLLIDCDLRNGRQHKMFKISSKKGLSTLLINNIREYDEYVHKTKIENLYVISRGVYPPNPSDLLSSKKNQYLIEKLRDDFDIIILDGAPCIGISDSLVLSTLVDEVLLVTSVNNTRKTALNDVRKSLESIGANVAGCVVNKVKIKRALYGNSYYGKYGYGYGYGYGRDNEEEANNTEVESSEEK